MPLLILIAHNEGITEKQIGTALAPAPKTTLAIPPGNWLIKSDESPFQIKKKLKKSYPALEFTIFTTPSTNWETTFEDGPVKEWIQDGVNSGPQFGSIAF